MALRIGKFAGNGPGIWLRMQQAYDLWYAEHRMKAEPFFSFANALLKAAFVQWHVKEVFQGEARYAV